MIEDHESLLHKKHQHIGFFLFIFFGVGLGLFFAWRIFYFTKLLHDGRLSSLPSFAQQMSLFAGKGISATSLGMKEGVVSEDDPFLGTKGAPLTIVEFADFACPFSQQVSFIIRTLALQYPEKIYYIYRDFPQEELHPNANLASQAARCAKDQNKFWEFHDKIYQQPSDLSQERFLQYARSLNLDITRFTSCLDSKIHAQEVQDDYEAGLRAGVYGTPTFFLNGTSVPGAIPADVFRQLIE